MSFFLHLTIYVVRIGYIDDFTSDPRVSVWQVPAIPIALALGGAVLYSVVWWLLALGILGMVARAGGAFRSPRLVLKSVRQAHHNAAFARCLIWQARLFLPARHRGRYESEWLAELDYLRAEQKPCASWAMGILCSAPWTGLVLRGRFWLTSPFSRQLYRLAPLGSGLITAIAVFSTIAAGWFPRDGEPPSQRQVVYAALGALLFGVLAGLHTWKERRRQEDSLKRDQQQG